MGAAPTSPGYAAYERANQLFVAKKMPEALAAAERSSPPRSETDTGADVESQIGDGSLPPGCRAAMPGASARARSACAVRQFLYGLEAYLGNDLAAALPRLRKARQLNPSDPRTALYLGLTVESLGRPEEALALYEEAVRLERAAGALDADTLLPGARLLLLLGRLKESEQWIRQANEHSPNSRDVHFELARLLLKSGDATQAAAEGETALALSEGVVTDAAIHYLLIRAYEQSGNPDRAAMHAEIMRAQEIPQSEKRSHNGTGTSPAVKNASDYFLRAITLTPQPRLNIIARRNTLAKNSLIQWKRLQPLGFGNSLTSAQRGPPGTAHPWQTWRRDLGQLLHRSSGRIQMKYNSRNRLPAHSSRYERRRRSRRGCPRPHTTNGMEQLGLLRHNDYRR